MIIGLIISLGDLIYCSHSFNYLLQHVDNEGQITKLEKTN